VIGRVGLRGKRWRGGGRSRFRTDLIIENPKKTRKAALPLFSLL